MIQDTHIYYKSGYKHQLVASYRFVTRLRPDYDILTPYISLTTEGQGTLRGGYAWDGATGVPDTRKVLRGSAKHDGLYQLIRLGLLPISAKAIADAEFRADCLQDRMDALLAWAYWRGVVVFGGASIASGSAPVVLCAP